MNIVQLTYFKCVVDEKSVTKAAQKLFVTQSAVSQQIRLLAEELECQLFYRKGRRLQVTADGEFIYHKAKRILFELEGLRDDIKSRRGDVVGNVIVGSGPIVSKTLLPDVVSDMLISYPEVSFSMFEILSKNLIAAIMDAQIDIGVGQIDDSDDRIYCEKLFTGRQVMICPENSKWQGRESISAKELESENIIRIVGGSSGYASSISPSVKAGKKSFQLEAMNTDIILPYVKRGMGVALAPDYIMKLISPKGVIVVPLEDEIRFSWGIMMDKARPISRAARLFIDGLKQKLAEHGLFS